MPRRRSSADPPGETPLSALCRRAFRVRRKGDERRAMVLLREAAHTSDSDPRLWTLFGVQCARVGRLGEARRALSHAAWLRDRRHEPKKARVTRALLATLPAEAA